MTTNQTINGVSRRMLTALLCQVSEFHNRALVDELRALLDAPEKPAESVNKQLREALEGMVEYFPEGHSDGECFSVERARQVLALAAAQPQGDPVAYADPKSFENFKTLAHLGGLYAHEWMWANHAPGLVPLYAEQPAPVAVVLPERMEIPSDHAPAYVYRKGWNACLDEVARLNTPQ